MLPALSIYGEIRGSGTMENLFFFFFFTLLIAVCASFYRLSFERSHLHPGWLSGEER